MISFCENLLLALHSTEGQGKILSAVILQKTSKSKKKTEEQSAEEAVIQEKITAQRF